MTTINDLDIQQNAEIKSVENKQLFANKEILSTAQVLKYLGISKGTFAGKIERFPLACLTQKELDEANHLCIKTFKYYRKSDIDTWLENYPVGRRSSGPRARK